MESGHRRSQSDAAGLLDGEADVNRDTPQAPSHVRSVSLGSSASQFLQSLKLQDPAAFQQNLLADQLALPDQLTPHAAASTAGAGAGADLGAAAAAAGSAGVAQDRGAGQSARSKRAHRGSNGRTSTDAMQLDTGMPEQQPHGFTPLPAVVENSTMDSERDWDSDSDREGFGPNRRGGSRAGGRRGGCNGRSESELMLLDPKRVKRILANRESAARSKERRMNYTTELEGKLQALSVETDKLSSQLHSLNKQEGKLRASKADLEQQVHSMQQQLAQVVSDNHSLMSTLFQLQAAMGLPQALPDGIMPLGVQEHAAAADASHYQHAWQLDQQQQQQQQQYANSKQPTSPKPRKPRRHSKQQQQVSKQQQATQCPWSSSSYGAPAEPDLSDPAAAAAAPVAELPVRPKSIGAAAGGAGQVHLTAAGPAAAAAAAPVAGHVGSSSLVGVSLAPQAINTQPSGVAGPPPPLHVSPRQHQWHTGLPSQPNSSSSTPAATPHPHTCSSGANGHQQLPAAAAFAPAAPHVTGASSAPGGGNHHAGGLSSSSTAAAASAASMLLLGQQLPAPGVDAVMGDAEDDLAMLGAFLEEEEEPLAVGPASTHTAAAAAAAAAAVGGFQGQGQQGLGPYGGPGSAGGTVGGGGGAAAAVPAVPAAPDGRGVSAPTLSTAAMWPHSHMPGSMVAPPNGLSPRQAAAAATGVAGVSAAGMAPAADSSYRFRSSPALSDPVAGECWHPAHEELSSGSVGGSLTQGATPNLTPSARLGSEGVNGVSPAYAAGGWQHHQHHQQQHQYVGAGAAAAGGVGGTAGMLSPRGPAGVGTAGAGAVLAAPQVSPITPDSSRVRTPRVAAPPQPGGVAAVTGLMGAPAGLAQASPHFQQQQQQQQQYMQQHMQHQAQFVMGANPSAGWLGRGRHVRSASTGCVSGLGLGQGYEYDHLALLPPGSTQQAGAGAAGATHLQQQPQQQPGGMLALQHHTSLQVQVQHTSVMSGGSVVGFSTAAASAEFGQAAAMAAGPGPSQRAEGVSWQRHRRSHSHAASFMGQGGLMGQYDHGAS